MALREPNVEWIMSEGGPLVCIEASLAPSWGGVARLSVPDGKAGTDYDRACSVGFYTEPIPLQRGTALVVNTGPQDTAIWTSANGISYIVVVECAEPDVDEPKLLAGMDDRIFDEPLKEVQIEFASGSLTKFDSAEPGDELDSKVVAFTLEAGRYRVLSQTFRPDAKTHFVVHKLELVL